MPDNSPRFIRLSETDSTNKYMQMVATSENAASGSVVVADYQTSGRGQMGNSWESEAGRNLTFSVLFLPTDLPAGKPFVIAEAVALSVKYTLDKHIPCVAVKWPNDIYYKDSKIAGILIENVINQGKISQSVIGIGLNVNQMDFRSPNSISMRQITLINYDLMTILDDFLMIFNEFCRKINYSEFDTIHADYVNSLYRKEGFHLFSDSNGTFEAEIHDIEPSGHLILKKRNGSLSKYAFKEVSFH